MSDYRQSVRDYILASRRVLELSELTDEEVGAVQHMAKRLSVLFGDGRDYPED
ncbi:MAG: hypothetical protein H8K03_15115 [Nitrospira sp.]